MAEDRKGRMKRVRLDVDPALRSALITGAGGIAAAAGLGYLLPPAVGVPAMGVAVGLSGLAALAGLDRARSTRAEALARSVGELNVRLAATRIKLDGLQSRLDSEPIREADIAPTRASLAELTAEVGLLGGVLRDIATSVADHELKIAKVADEMAARPAPAAPAQPAAETAAPAEAPRRRRVAPLTAEPPPVVDAELRRRDDERERAIVAAFASGGIDLHLQPIVTLPHRRTMGYEALARLTMPDGSMLTPVEFLPALERDGQSANLDAQVLTRALALASRLNAREGDHFIAINLTAQAWMDLRTLHAVSRILETYRSAALRLVIDMPQRVYRSLDPARLGVIGAIKAGGVRFALDHLTDLRLDPVSLADRGVAFVKASAQMLSDVDEGVSGLDVAVADLGQLLRRAGVELIGERAESDRLVADLIELDVRMGQGFAISPPRPVRQEALQQADLRPAEPPRVENKPAAAPQPAAAEAAPAAPPPPQRVPFRSVLRRATA